MPFPTVGKDRWDALLLQGLADGAMTAMGRLFADEQRPDKERSSLTMTRFAQTRDTAIAWLETCALGEVHSIGEISVAAFLGYLDFRWPDRDWRAPRPPPV